MFVRGYFHPHGFDLVTKKEIISFNLVEAYKIWASINIPGIGFDLPDSIPENVRCYGSFEEYTPYTASIELTDKCNASCSFCYRDSGRDGANMLSGWHEILDSLLLCGVFHVQMTGGEPSIHHDFPDILLRATELFELVTVFSNGSNITQKIADISARSYEKVAFQIDIDSICPEKHDAIRGLNGLHSRAVNGIRLLSERGVTIRIAMNVTDDNVGEIADVCEFAKNLGASSFLPTPILPMGRATYTEQLTEKSLPLLSRSITRLANEFGTFILHPEGACSLTPEVARQQCGAGKRTITVGPDGRLRPCVLWPRDIAHFGKIEYNRGPFKAFSSLDRLDAPGSALCRECSHQGFCGGCIARAAIRAFDERCWFQDALKKYLPNAQTSEPAVTA